MAYVALYRKYRSQSFDELMGQEQVTVTLQNAIRSGRIGHAFLFYGARGCGKTSTARLLARAVNCVAQDGPSANPCGVCRLCTAIRDGACMDVIEMDAASETGIDDVREKIIENVQYAPAEARYKVYIIDEVHDLSAKAFDALLKTLEEPPAHVIFVLATTEYHKVPATIRSRCMQYHFKRGTLQDLAASIQGVIDKEGCTAEPEAVQTVARAAEGSWRDALSLLEQVLSYSDGHITAETVHRALGSVSVETLARVTDILAQGDWCGTLSIAGELIDSGKDVRQLLAALSSHVRDLMLLSVGAHTAAQQELGPDRYALLRAQAPLFDPPTLLAMTAALAQAEREIRFTNQHRWLLESTLLRMMPVNIGANIAASQAAQAAAPTVSVAPPAPRRETVSSTPSVVPRPQIVPPAPAVARPGPEAARPPIVATPQPDAVSEPVADARFAEAVTFEVVKRAWPRVLSLFRKASPSGAPWLEKGEVVALEGRTIVLAFADNFARDRIQNHAKGKAKIEQVVNQALSSEGYVIRCIARDPDDEPPTAPVRPPADSTPPSLDIGALAGEGEPETGSSFSAAGDYGISPGGAVSGNALTAEAPGPGYTAPPGSGQPTLLTEALRLFGGSVVRTEPMVS